MCDLLVLLLSNGESGELATTHLSSGYNGELLRYDGHVIPWVSDEAGHQEA